jgi:acyl-CoA dehydrogenase
MSFRGFDLPDELRALSQTVETFVRKEIIPAENDLDPDATELPAGPLAALQRKARAAGFWCFDTPEAYGGCGLSAFAASVVTEQAGKHKFCFPFHGGGVFGYDPPTILLQGSHRQIEKYVIPAVEFGHPVFTAISEASGGSDPARAIRTTAVRKGGAYVLSGHKMWASNADRAPYGIVFARTGPGRAGISAFVVESDLPGVSTRPIAVIRDHHSAELVLDSCEVPVGNLLGAEGQGFEIAQQWLVRGRIRLAAHCVGLAEESLRIGIEWANQRETFGAKLSTRQAVQFALADIRVELNAARHLVWEAAWALDQGHDARTAASIAKLYATEAGARAVDSVMQILGGMGMAREMPLERWYRGLRVWRVGDGPSEVHRVLIARELLSGKAGR